MVGVTELQFKSDLLETQRVLEENKIKLSGLKTCYPLDITEIINTQLEVESLEDGIRRMNELGKELGFLND
jgi:hypothetical protein